MKIYANVKKAGSRRNALEKKEYDVPFSECRLGQIIAFFVEKEVQAFNSRSESGDMLTYLTEKDITAAASEGKVGFGSVYRDKKADLADAVKNALECFEDGLVRVFLNGEEITGINQEIKLSEGDVFTFMRLTFLSGRMW